MSKVYLTPIRLANLNSDPVGHKGDVYFNKSINLIKYHDGNYWNILSPGLTASDVGDLITSTLSNYGFFDGGTASGYTNSLDGGNASTTFYNNTINLGAA